MQRDTSSERFPLGSPLPPFELLNVDGRRVSSESLKGSPAVLVGFLCNHCPYVQGSEEMLIGIVRRYRDQGLKAVMINSNDVAKYPEDSFERMREKAAALDLPYPYLYDESQAVARAFDAACTPEFYLFDQGGALVYHGTVNDSPRNPGAVQRDYLSNAIASVLKGEIPNPQFVHPLGCSIKWK